MSTRLTLVDAARGAAAAAVLLYHGLASFPADTLHPALAFIKTFTTHGWLGVHVFFTLSGWCVAERLAAALRRRESPRAFLRDRLLRIYPAYWAALLLAICLRLAATPFNHTPPSAAFPASPLHWVGDLTLFHVGLGTPASLMVGWTLFYELSYYASAVLALVLLSTRRVPPAWLLVAGALLCLCPLLGPPSGPLRPLDGWMDFFLGALAWRAARRAPDASTFAALGIVALAALLLAGRDLLGAGALVSWGVAALLFAASRHPRLSTALSPAPLLSLGLVSYSLYLVHVPVLSPLLNLAARFFPTTGAGFAFAWLAAILAAFAAGHAFHRLVEAPCEKWRRRIAPRPAPLAPAVCPS